MKILVITPVYNKVEYTEQFIKSLQNTDAGLDYELVIINNASTDKTKEFLSPENFKGIKAKAIWNKKNKGFSIANNQGAELSTKDTKYYCFLNNDMVVTDNWLKELVRCIERHPKAVIVGGKLIHPCAGSVQHAGVEDLNGHRPNHKYFGMDQNSPVVNKEKQYPAVTGACMLIKKDFYDSVGGFDEDYWCGWEDIDLCKKALALGFEVWYNPKVVIYHYEGSTEGRMLKEDANFALFTQRWVNKSLKVKLLNN